jgi:hypothetical protein
LRDQHAVIAVELDHVGNRAERDQIEQAVQTRFGESVVESAAAAQFRAQRQQHIKHHAHTGDALARERAARLVRVDDGPCSRQFVTGEVVISDQHVDAERIGRCHAIDAGDAVIDRNQQFRLARRTAGGQRDDLRRQAITVLEAVRHQILDLAAKHAQAAHRDRAGGGAVTIVVGDHYHAAFALNRVGEQRRSAFAALERGRRHEPRETGFDFIGHAHAARGVQAREHRVQAMAGEDFGVDR